MKYKDYKIEVLKYIISYFRQNKDIKNVLQKYNIYIHNVNELNDVLL